MRFWTDPPERISRHVLTCDLYQQRREATEDGNLFGLLMLNSQYEDIWKHV